MKVPNVQITVRNLHIINLLKPTGHVMHQQFNPLKTKRRLLYLKTQVVPRSKHFPSRL